MLQLLQEFLEDLLKVLEYGDEIIKGFATTMWLYVVGLVIGFFLGLLLAVSRQYGGWFFSRIAAGYIELMRGTPLLVQTYLIFFFPSSFNAILHAVGLPPLEVGWGISISLFGRTVTILDHRILSAFVVLGLNSAAYQAEYFRGAIASVGAGQMLAGRALGMGRLGSIGYVVLPQALRRVIPAWSNEAVYLPVYTVVVYFIGVEELFAKAKLIVTRTFTTLMTYTLIAIIFLVLVSLLSKLLDFIHKQTSIPGL